MRYLIFLFLFISVLISCKEEMFNPNDIIPDYIQISNCSDIIDRLEMCLDIHEGALDYLGQNCSEETVVFVRDNIRSCDQLVDYLIKM